MSIAQRLLPAPLRALRWRLPWLRSSGALEEAQLSTLLRAARFTLAELRGGELRLRTPDGLAFASMPNNFSSFALHVAGARDPNIWRFIQARLRPGATVVDAGANIGAYTLPIARLVGPAGRVLAFEAHPLTFGYLARNITANGLVQAIPLHHALGAASGVLRLRYIAANPGETHVAPEGGGGATEVPVVTLDAALAGQGIGAIDYLKIDVEGFELPVLRGARTAIAASPGIAVQTELQEKHARRYGHAIADIVALLTGLGLAHHIRADGSTEPVQGPIAGDVVWFRR